MSPPPDASAQSPAAAREQGRRYRAPARLIGGQFQIESRAPVALLSGLTLAALCLIFPPLSWWPIAYVALVPWLVAVTTTDRARWVYVASYALGVAFFLVNVRWLAPLTLPGYATLSIVFGGVFPLTAWPLRHMFRRHGTSMAIALPVVWTAVEFVRSQTLVGFPWFLLAHSQYRQVTLIQIADLVGALGVSFVVAMVNGWVTDLFIQPILIWRRDQPERTTRLPIGSLVTMIVVSFALTYGALSQRPRSHGAAANPGATDAGLGPRVALVQHDFPSYIDHRARRTGEYLVYDSYMQLVRHAAAARPDLIVLPETAWRGYFNDEFINADAATLENIRTREFTRDPPGGAEMRRTWSRQTRTALQKVGAAAGAAIVTGAAAIEWKPLEIPPRIEKYNSAFLLLPDASQPIQRYDKVHIVLFGEFVPFRFGKLHFLYQWLNSITPWGATGYEYSITAGREFRPFEFSVQSAPGRTFRAGAPICYEDTEPYVARSFSQARSADSNGRGKAIDMLLNISNDGWFAHSSELESHLAASVFRAVENRVGVARAVNTGASALIDPDGRIHARVALSDAQRQHLPAVRRTLETVRDGVTGASRRDAIGELTRLQSQLAAYRSIVTGLGAQFGYLADRLQALMSESVTGLATGGDGNRDLVEQIDEDLATLDRWQSHPDTAPGVVIDHLRIDERYTLYTRWGDWLPTGCLALGGAMVLDWILHRVRGRPAVAAAK